MIELLDATVQTWNEQSLPRVDALGSRQFLMALMPELCIVPSALRPLNPPIKKRRIRALDVGKSTK
jgi:protein N-terminal methyltransferase